LQSKHNKYRKLPVRIGEGSDSNWPPEADHYGDKFDPSKAVSIDYHTKILNPRTIALLSEKLDFELATGVEGIDDEIALLRVKIKSILEHDPENIKLIMQATNTLARLVRTRYNIGKEDKQGLKEAIGTVLRDVALPLGISIGTTINE